MAYDTGKYRSFSIKKEGEFGAGNLLNPSFEDWTYNEQEEKYEINNWIFLQFGDAVTKNSYYERSEDAETGDYSISLTSYAEDYASLIQKKTGLTPGDWKILKINTKSVDATQISIGLFNDDSFDEYQLSLNWVTKEWNLNSFEDDNVLFFDAGDNEFEEYISVSFQVPENGTLVALVLAVGEEGAVTLIDDFDIYDYTPADAVAVFEHVAENFDATDLGGGDYSIMFRSKGGIPKLFFGIDHMNMMDTTADWLGSKKDFLTNNTLGFSNSALNGFNGVRILNQETPLIDLTSTGATQLAELSDLPYGWITTGILVVTIYSNSANGDAEFDIGTKGTDYNNILDYLNTSYSVNGKAYHYINLMNRQLTPHIYYDSTISEDDIYINVRTADTGTDCYIRVYLFGFFLDTGEYTPESYTGPGSIVL